jgi:penicillin V acylase-like amidase (Ntn superfamily)
MKRTLPRPGQTLAVRFALVLASIPLAITPARACTIFVLTDTNRALFCNNEDWSNPNTRVWFVPARWGDYGYAAVGFDDGWSQGGINTKGLAYDVVAGFQEKWKADFKLLPARGHSPLRMLATCATVEEAIAFYRKRQEPGFSRCKILVDSQPAQNSVS